jgi:hypothetical protein
MAKETLSIDLDPGLIDRVRRYSEEHGTDVADTIGDLIAGLPFGNGSDPAHSRQAADASQSEADTDWEASLPPITRSLLGAGSGNADEEDYKEYLWRKYGP